MASEPILRVSGISLRKGRAILLEDISFTLERGRFYGLLGPNGAGKSSLLKILYRAETANAGKVELDGRPVHAWGRRVYAAKVGALVQEKVSLSGMSLLEVVELGLLPLALPSREVRERANDALRMIDLAHRAGEDAAHLSGGEQQRLFFAQLLALDPDIYLLDEPNNHLDLHFQYKLLDIVKRRQRTVLASFHDIGLAVRYCDEVMLLDGGRLVGQGEMARVLDRRSLAKTYRVAGTFEAGRLEISGPI
ncbi:ATP-binding cassette domain-containing protein [Aestuariivirga sp. YIM B02566]|uniref:ABC transporter ATP-binding protein n=1 Tax=Taklimakanibacter albus TaxID=2800327 RepID=A0ACC5R231_9HYPH|nr:ABC transporter ATP-binding protein [Aestuariivirga sp. YIM B02566]